MAKNSVYDYDPTAANNTDIGGVGIVGTVNTISNLDNAQREMAGHIGAFVNDQGGALTAGGSANALTITSGATITALGNGLFFKFRAASDNTGAATLNLNALGAKAIRKMDATGDVALAAGDIQATGIYEVAYSEALNGAAGAWLLLNPTQTNVFASVDINGGTIDGTAIGGSAPAAGAFTTLSSSGAATLASGSVTGAWTVNGAFTSLGIDDNATGERLQIADALITIGSATAASDYYIVRAVDDGTLRLTGNNAEVGASGIILYGNSHATKAKDVEILANASIVYTYDFSATQHQFTGPVYTSGAARIGQNTTNTPGSGNNTQGVGITDTSGQLFASATNAQHVFNRTNDGTLMNLNSGGNNVGTISLSGATASYNAFFASHWSQLADNSRPDILRGTICETIDQMVDWGAEGVDERLPRFKINDTPGSKRPYGVFAWWEDDPDLPDCNYCLVGAVGAYFIRIASGVSVQGGDLIESNGDGCGRVQADDIIRASTVAKVTSSEVFESYPDGSYTVPCTLLCG